MVFQDHDRVWRDRFHDGDGPPIVLVHGTMDRASSFGRMARILFDRKVIGYDRRGYAKSIHLGPPTRFEEQVDDLVDVIGEEPAVLFGHSYGGTVALATAARAPESVVGVVAFECPLPWMDWWPSTSVGATAARTSATPGDAAEAFMIRMIGERRWQKLPPSTREARRAEGATLVAELRHMRPPNPAPFDLRDISVPVVAAYGAQGAAHHRHSMLEIAGHVEGAQLVEVPESGHGVHLSHPAEAAALIAALPAGPMVVR